MNEQAYPPFGGADARKVSPDDARVAVLPVAYEGTVSYGKGTAKGPRAILEASAQLEMYDEELERCTDEEGFHTLPPVEPASDAPPEAVMAEIQAAALPSLRAGKLLLTLGGEHSITWGVLKALLEVRENRPFSVLQIDAHADLRDTYRGHRHSHASIMARVHELGLPFVQVGTRSLSLPEREFLKDTGLERNVFWARTIKEAGTADASWMDAVLERLAGDIYITLDVDALDSGIMPATGPPEPGGLSYETTLRLLRKVAESRPVAAMDLVELAPIPGLHAPDFLAARLAHKMIGYALPKTKVTAPT